ncbi:transcriptional regulator [Tissierella pigra]|uniref:Transcriptional regulator n=1 Tax=Tissierella pigra TaxID=2607614 RepID=A0A6N7XUQ7_9FIRM|nr:type IV toxin-antitoxin system AbiEi family antitoxin [Tissierella pigra]MBU5424887.1 transcriptional regulator [Tissierella pigra]MSU01173.1 transcriptional regulator [Tissierella pigra]
MNLYIQLAKYPTFTIEEVKEFTLNVKTAYFLLDGLIKKGLVKKVKNNIYSVVNPATGQIYANRYQIACAITDTAYISHHSAFEYYGLANQVFYEVYVSSEVRFTNFEYGGITYKYVASRMDEGIEEVRNTRGIRITSLERTLIDSINDFNKIGGFEELLNCIEGIHYLDEEKLKKYLDIYNKQVLYQRTGYILKYFQNRLNLSVNFIEYCKSRIGKSMRYLINDSKEENLFDKEWNLMIPDGIFEIGDQGGNILV